MELGPSDVKEGVAAARALLDADWLKDQHRREPNDPLLYHLKVDRSPQFQIHGIRYGVPEGMHPLAEAVMVGEEVLAQYQRDGRFLGSPSFYLLLSLRDLITHRTQIENIENRIPRLYSSEEWKPTLYELMTAAAYASTGVKVRFLQEDQEPRPDIELLLGRTAFVECKARLSYENQVVEFISKWRRDALGPISDYLRRVDAGFIVRVTLHNEAAIRDMPAVIQAMVTAGERTRDTSRFRVDIVPIDPGVVSIGPDPMPVFSAEFWRRALGFDEWRSWHYVLPGGWFDIVNLSNALAKAFRKPTLVCVKSTELADNTIKVLPILRDACRRQLRTHYPGIIHVLVNTDLFGLDEKASIDFIEGAFREATEEVFRNYTRLYRVVYDLVTPPEPGQYRVQLRRLGLANERCQNPSPDYFEPPAVLIL